MNELKIEARGLFRWIKGARLVFIVLTLIGVARVIGTSTGTNALVRFGNFFAASPAPVPFQNPRSSDDTPNSGLFLRCLGQENLVKEMRWSTELQRKVPGPHRHYVFFLNLNKHIAAGRAAIYVPALQKAFCGEGYLAAALECPLPVNRIEFVYRGLKPIHRVIECAK